MAIFELKVTWQSKATVYVEAADEYEAAKIYECSSHLPDADEIEQDQMTSIALADPNISLEPNEVLRRG